MSHVLSSPVLLPLRRVAALVPGLALSLLIASVATLIGGRLPVLGSAVPGVLLGIAVRLLFRPGRSTAGGIGFAGRGVLQASVVLLGTQLSLAQIARVGVSSLPVMLGTLAICLAAAWLFGRLLGVIGNLRTLIGVGTAICGGSAIAAVSPVIGALSAEVAYAISTIFLFNIAAVVTFPMLGHLLGLSQQAFGLFAGTAVNDTSSVVAAAAAYGPEAAQHAVVVKLVRSLMIIPICVGLAAVVRRRSAAAGSAAATEPTQPIRLVPWFLVGFVVMAVINSLGLIPVQLQRPLGHVALFMITVALSAIGLSTDVAALRRTGARPLLLGALLWITVTAGSLALQALSSAIGLG